MLGKACAKCVVEVSKTDMQMGDREPEMPIGVK